MAMILRQSTAEDVLIGPFVDLTDGATAETGESPTVKLSKNGEALAAKSDVTTPVHDADGYYNCELDGTDTGTVGTLTLTVAASANALPVRHEFQVVEETVYDALYAASAAGFLATSTLTVSEPSQAKPTATPTAEEILSYLYVEWIRNKIITDTSGTDFKKVHNDAGTVIYKKSLSDAASILTVGEAETGP